MMMNDLIEEYKKFWSDKQILKSIFIGFLILWISLVINYYAGIYASISQSNYVTDIILSNTRARDVDEFFVYGTFAYFLFMIIYCISRPFQTPYIIKCISIFVIIRSVFITLTHLWAYPWSDHIDTSMTLYGIFSKMPFTGDLFFSGHTGLPFLMGLIFWKYKILRYIFLILSVFFGVIVLLGHLHYSIDVLAAFFITYTIHDICIYIFAEDRRYFEECFNKKISANLIK